MGEQVSEILEMGKVSARGQIAIPVEIRKEMELEEGSKVIFLLEDDTLLIKKVSLGTWERLTEPFRKVKKKIGEDEVAGLIHRARKR